MVYCSKGEIRDQLGQRIPQLKLLIGQFKELIVDHLGLNFLQKMKLMPAGKVRIIS